MSSEIETFVLVVEEGSFSAAARTLGVRPSTVSRQVTRLEERLGVLLLHRSTRSVTLTQVGSVYFEGAVRIFRATQQLEAMVRDAGSGLRGKIRVAAPMSKQRLLSSLVASFLDEYPQARVTMVPTNEIGAYRQDRIDVGIHIGELSDHDWTARRLGEIPMCLAAAPAYLKEFGWPESLGDLEDHHCITSGLHPTWGLSDGGTIEPDPRVVVADHDSLVRCVRSGIGIGYLYTSLIDEDLRTGRLCRLLPGQVQGTEDVWVLYPRDQLFPPTARAFVEHAVEYFPTFDAEQLD